MEKERIFCLVVVFVMGRILIVLLMEDLWKIVGCLMKTIRLNVCSVLTGLLLVVVLCVSVMSLRL